MLVQYFFAAPINTQHNTTRCDKCRVTLGECLKVVNVQIAVFLVLSHSTFPS